MCGRFAQYCSLETLRKIFRIDTVTCQVTPDYNIVPGNKILAVIRRSDNRLGRLSWGLLPSWIKNPSGISRPINARAETLQEKPSFRDAFKKRRCLIIADGYYEWKREKHNKRPWHLALPFRLPFAFAGIWEAWKGEGEEIYNSCAIITTEARAPVDKIHDRMPVILSQESHKDWLDPRNQNAEELEMILQNARTKELEAYPVSTLVNFPRNNDPVCIAPVSDHEFL